MQEEQSMQNDSEVMWNRNISVGRLKWMEMERTTFVCWEGRLLLLPAAAVNYGHGKGEFAHVRSAVY